MTTPDEKCVGFWHSVDHVKNFENKLVCHEVVSTMFGGFASGFSVNNHHLSCKQAATMPGGTITTPVNAMVRSGPHRNKGRENDAAVVFHLKLKDDPRCLVREAMTFFWILEDRCT
jgi:hypothetical protein